MEGEEKYPWHRHVGMEKSLTMDHNRFSQCNPILSHVLLALPLHGILKIIKYFSIFPRNWEHSYLRRILNKNDLGKEYRGNGQLFPEIASGFDDAGSLDVTALLKRLLSSHRVSEIDTKQVKPEKDSCALPRRALWRCRPDVSCLWFVFLTRHTLPLSLLSGDKRRHRQTLRARFK